MTLFALAACLVQFYFWVHMVRAQLEVERLAKKVEERLTECPCPGCPCCDAFSDKHTPIAQIPPRGYN